MNELLDVVDEFGNPTGKTADRETVHREGLLHRTAHVWLVRWTKRNRQEVLIQKRSRSKDAFPGCWDISSAGHIPAGEEWIPSALRELKEELGVLAKPRDLHFVGKRRIETDGVFHGRPFHNRQISAVYFLVCNDEERPFKLQASEVSEVKWVPLCRNGLMERLNRPSFPNCICKEELEWVARHPAFGIRGKLGAAFFPADKMKAPQSLLERVRFVVRPEDYFDCTPRFRHRRLKNIVPDADWFLDRTASKKNAWILAGCEVSQQTGRFIRSHWNIRDGKRLYRLVLNYRGNIYKLKEISTLMQGREFYNSRRAAAIYDLTDRVNRALMDAARGIPDRWEAIRHGKTIVP